MHRAWIDTKVALGGGDKTILESVEAGEDNAKDTYKKALSGALPAQLAEIVRRQAASVQRLTTSEDAARPGEGSIALTPGSWKIENGHGSLSVVHFS